MVRDYSSDESDAPLARKPKANGKRNGAASSDEDERPLVSHVWPKWTRFLPANSRAWANV